jgi:uncharacterized protein (TIGR03083 family)
LLTLLRDLPAERWSRPTAAGDWTVHDVAAHLLDGDLRKLAIVRDGHAAAPPEAITSERELAQFLRALNADGVGFGRRLSPRLLVDLLEITGEWVTRLLESLPPFGPARFAVSWAGESESRQWMDTGREYTERWHHQAQIRDAVGAPLLLSARWFDAVMDISMRALPHAFASVAAPVGAALVVEVAGETRQAWSLVREPRGWALFTGPAARHDTTARMTADTAWRLLFNGLSPEAARARLEVAGAPALAETLAHARAVIV